MTWPDYLFESKTNEFRNEAELRQWIRCVHRAFDAIRNGLPSRFWMEWFACDDQGRIAAFDAQFEGVVPLDLLHSSKHYILAYLDVVRLIWEKMRIGVIRRDFGPVERYTAAGLFYYSIEPFRSEPAHYVQEGTPAAPLTVADLQHVYPNIHRVVVQSRMADVTFRNLKTLKVTRYLACTDQRSC